RSSDLTSVFFRNRGWSKPHAISYMESHDEPWLMYKNLRFGRSSSDGSYNVQDLSTALNRIKLVATFFFTIPGPKMMWQFGELGYDQNLPESGPDRTAPKPILWNYFQNPVFTSVETDVFMRAGQGQFDRRINLSHPSMNVTIIGNFDVEPRNVVPNFQHTGKWYDFFFADSLEVQNPNQSMPLQPGEFHLFVDKKIPFPAQDLVTSVAENEETIPDAFALFQNYPNPFNPETSIRFTIPASSRVTLRVYNALGQRVRTLVDEVKAPGTYTVKWDGSDTRGIQTSSGLYFVRLKAGGFVRTIKLLKLK
ncbi:MAG: T9SS C-terminal target domain-containing protein, partial [Calditrichaeota bacterium]